MSHAIILFFLFILVTQHVSVSNQHRFFLRIYTGWSKSLCAPDDDSTKNTQKYSILNSFNRLTWTVLYWTRSSRTQFGMSINVWRLAGDTWNITCNFLYCNHQVHRDFLITLYIFSAEYCTCTCIQFIAYFSNFNTDFNVCVYSLEDVLMEESRLYLIFEFLSMDLKKYLDSLGTNKLMDTNLVRSYLYQVKLKFYYFQKCS